MTGSIFVLPALAAPDEGRLRSLAVGREVFLAGGQAGTARARAAFDTAEICFGNVPPEWVGPDLGLQWLQLTATGTEMYQGVPWPEGVRVSNLRGVNDVAVAETVVAGLLALHRRLPELLVAQAEQEWVRWPVRGRAGLLSGANVVVLGAGTIARRLRRQMDGFDCTVTLFGRTRTHADLTSSGELDEALSRADIVVSCLPETSETTGFVDRRRLALLPPGAIFVNVGRGPVVDEEAVLDLLDEGHLAGCVMDVTIEEPLPPDSRWWSAPRCILTQHTGGGWQEEDRAKAALFLENLQRYLSGEPLRNELDLDRGY